MKFKFSNIISIIILFQGIIFLKILYDLMPKNWDLNRSIGWGWENPDQFYYYYQNIYWLAWIIIFPVLFWRVIKPNRVIGKILAICQVLIITLIVVNLLFPFFNSNYLNIANWIILGASLLITFNKLNSEKEEQRLLDKIIDSK